MQQLEIENLKQFTMDELLRKASIANDRTDINSLIEVAQCCGLIDLETDILNIWEQRKAELIQQHRDADITHLEWLRGQ